MGAMPADLSPGLRKDARIGLGKAHGSAPGLLERQPFRQRKLVMGVSDLRNVEGKAGSRFMVEAQENRRLLHPEALNGRSV